MTLNSKTEPMLAAWQKLIEENRMLMPYGNIARGAWHGYLNEDQTIMRGTYILCRWAEPTVQICHDNMDKCMELAWYVEEGIKRMENDNETR